MSEEQLIQTPGVFGETGNFLLERELGRGGMGGVYMGRDKMLDRPVAVKVMLKEYGSDAEFVEKFKREAQAAARLIHPNIAQVYSYGIADGMPYIAMELVAGGSLDQVMKNAGGATDIPRVMKICEQVAQALRCAADQGLVHGDVKPENVLLDSNGNAKLVDFGLAAMQKDTDEVWGTPYYIAPEKVKKEPVDYRADMYSLGGTLYHALTGVAPFEGDDANAVVRRRFEAPPAAPSSIRADISPQIDALVLKMLALNPADRFPSFEALLEEFRRVMASGLTTVKASPLERPGGRKIVMKGRKRFKVKTSAEGGGESPREREDVSAPPPEEEGGSVLGKVLGAIGITVAAIALIAGGLVWYVVADKKAKEAAKQAECELKTNKAREAIAGFRKSALQFADNCDIRAAKILKTCQDPTDKLKQKLSGKFDPAVLARLKPGPSSVLLAAIALTNGTAEVSAGTNAVASADAKSAPAAKVKTVAVAVPASKIPKFRAPTEDEADPASPEHKTYLEEKEKWEKEQLAKIAVEAAGKQAAAAQESSGDAPAEDAKSSAFEAAMKGIIETAIRETGTLWERAYGCQAAAIRIRHKVTKLVEKIDAFKGEGKDREETLKLVADFSNTVKGEYEEIKASDDVTTLEKGDSFIKSKGSKAVEQTANNLIRAAKEEERRQIAAEKARREKERLERLEKEKRETMARDSERIKEKFEALIAAGVFRQLDWKGAMRQLNAVKDDFKYAESQVEADVYIRKVKMMATVQEVFIANCKGYQFRKGKGLVGFKIADISEKEIKLLKPDGKNTVKMNWVKFYKDFHGGLNELINKFIQGGKNVSKMQDGKRLSLMPWADAMMGAALTMQIICSDNPTAAQRAEQIAKAAVKELPDYLARAKLIFPDIKFEAVEE